MAVLKNIVAFLVLSALLTACYGQVSQGGPHGPQGGPHQDQGRIRRQASQNEDDVNEVNEDQAGPNVQQNPQNWTTCDITAVPRISCHDCNTRLICKPIGGILKICNNPARPYCNFGICSPVPSANCV
ncbi:uncharacterized protein LOC124536886 [Vanessa cardui]|uniref:uncharacterized protein LOC124536886 n=1 Tax=Vanessa cardui TaxID=171605 RepID=UPI001F139880|nr:uncharacterized protein LOC124536886 [Vanessa cardui]